MSEEFDQNKTEEATPRRREKAREDGDVAFSPDLGAGLVLVAIATGASLFLDPFLKHLQRPIIDSFSHLRRMDWGVCESVLAGHWLLGHLCTITAFLIGIATCMGIVGAQIQSGVKITFQPLMPKWSRLSITSGWSRLFSMESGARGGLAILKIASTATVVGWLIISSVDLIRVHSVASFHSSMGFAVGLGLQSVVCLAIVTLAWGLVDFGFRWLRHEKKLKMSKQDVKDEQKDDQGDPQLRARMRRIQRDNASRQRMIQDVANATMVITNPTHYAVALKYETGSMSAPTVVAKGTDGFARRLSEEARKSGVPVLERKPLTRAIFAMANVGDEIPSVFYQAIAELLSAVYRLKGVI